MILKTNLDQKDIDLYNEKFAEIENIPGFPMGLDQYICDFMLSMQNKAKIEGNLSELGTYKGKYAAKMAKYLNNNEFIFIVDVSDLTDPIKNINLVNPDAKVEALRDFTANIEKSANYNQLLHSNRYIHIDASHNADDLYHDLSVAEKMLKDTGGIVAIDDIFVKSYANLTETLYRYLEHNPYDYRMFLLGDTKAYLCRPKDYDFYYSLISENLVDYINYVSGRHCKIYKRDSIGNCYTITIFDDPKFEEEAPDIKAVGIGISLLPFHSYNKITFDKMEGDKYY